MPGSSRSARNGEQGPLGLATCFALDRRAGWEARGAAPGARVPRPFDRGARLPPASALRRHHAQQGRASSGRGSPRSRSGGAALQLPRRRKGRGTPRSGRGRGGRRARGARLPDGALPARAPLDRGVLLWRLDRVAARSRRARDRTPDPDRPAGPELELRGAGVARRSQAGAAGDGRRRVPTRRPAGAVRALGGAQEAGRDPGRNPLLRQAVGGAGGSDPRGARGSGVMRHFKYYLKGRFAQRLGLVALSLAGLAASAAAQTNRPGFAENSLWDDGRSEFSQYEGTTRRYGETRPTRARIVIVKEDMLR